MKLNRVTIILSALVLLAGLMAAGKAWLGGTTSTGHVGTTLLPDLDLTKAAQITITSAEGMVTLHLDDDRQWRVKEQSDFQADAKKIKETLVRMSNTRLAHKVTSNQDKLLGLGVLTQEENGGKLEADKTGTRMDILDASGNSIYSVIVGNIRSAEGTRGAGGQYVRYPQEPAAYLIGETLLHDTSPRDWIDRMVLNVNAGETIQSYRITLPGKAPTVLHRAKPKEPWKLEGTPDDKVNQQEAESVANMMAALDVYSVAPAGSSLASLGRDIIGKLEIHFFDKRSYHLTVGTQKGLDDFRFITIQGQLGQDVTDEKLVREMETFNRKYQGRIFGIYDWDGGRLISERQTFLPAKK